MPQASTMPYQPFTPEYISPQPAFVVPIIESAPVSTSFEDNDQTKKMYPKVIYLGPQPKNKAPSLDPLVIVTIGGLLGLFGLLAFLVYIKR